MIGLISVSLSRSIMINEQPSWMFAARYRLSDGYEHVQLVGDRVLGYWVCLNRCDGTLIWERTYWRPNEIVAIAENVVVATEESSSGCFGISLETGRLLWTSHASGWRGRMFRALDFVPCFANELRDAPHHVQGQECFCYSGRVIDLCSGRDLRRIPKDEVIGGTSTADSVPVHARAAGPCTRQVARLGDQRQDTGRQGVSTPPHGCDRFQSLVISHREHHVLHVGRCQEVSLHRSLRLLGCVGGVLLEKDFAQQPVHCGSQRNEVSPANPGTRARNGGAGRANRRTTVA